MTKFAVSLGPKMKVARVGNFGAGRESIYPWKELDAPQTDESGEIFYSQFFVPGKNTKRFSSVAQAAAKRLGITLSVRAANEDGVDGVLIQRVEPRAPRPPRTPEQIEAMKARMAAGRAAKAAAKNATQSA